MISLDKIAFFSKCFVRINFETGSLKELTLTVTLPEKAITSSDYKAYILLLDMSKAVDTVNRNKLFETLEEILHPDEIHLLHILTNDVK